MIIIGFMTLAVLFGVLVLVILLVGRIYEVRHKVGELTDAQEELEEDEQLLINKPEEDSNSKENL